MLRDERPEDSWLTCRFSVILTSLGKARCQKSLPGTGENPPESRSQTSAGVDAHGDARVRRYLCFFAPSFWAGEIRDERQTDDRMEKSEVADYSIA
jgi:hypothetical protein